MTGEELRWPKKGDHAFAPSLPASARAQLGIFVLPSDEVYCSGFKRAADMIVDAALNDCMTSDALFFPVAYLYRHHLEMMLKNLVRLGSRLDVIEVSDGILGQHDLHKLWSAVRRLIEVVSPDSSRDDIVAVERVLLDFHRNDRKGDAFRYAHSKSGTPNLQNAPKHVDLVNLKETVGAVSAYLDAVDAYINAGDPGCAQ